MSYFALILLHLNIILSVQTDLVILAHVDLSLKTDALVKAEQIWRTPLKLWRQRQMSATAVHFSMACEKQCAMFRGGATRNLVLFFTCTRHDTSCGVTTSNTTSADIC